MVCYRIFEFNGICNTGSFIKLNQSKSSFTPSISESSLFFIWWIFASHLKENSQICASTKISQKLSIQITLKKLTELNCSKISLKDALTRIGMTRILTPNPSSTFCCKYRIVYKNARFEMEFKWIKTIISSKLSSDSMKWLPAVTSFHITNVRKYLTEG